MVMSLLTIFITMSVLLMVSDPAAAIRLIGPETGIGPQRVQDFIQDHRVFIVVELADLRRPEQQTPVIGNRF